MPTIGPHRFTVTNPKSNDLHIIYRGSGGSLKNPKVVQGPQPKKITASGNRVDIEWDTAPAPNTTLLITVQSDFRFTTPDSYVFTEDGNELGPWVPYMPEDGAFEAPAVPSRAVTARRTPTEIEVVNRLGERTTFSPERLAGSLVLGDRTADEARLAVNTLTPMLRATGRTPISTIGLRGALGEVLLNPTRPDGTAVRDALVGDGTQQCPCPRGPAPLVGNEDELVRDAGMYLEKVDRAMAAIEGGKRPPEGLIGIYDEGVAIHATAVELSLASTQFCLHPLTGGLITPVPLPRLEELIALEERLRFVPSALIRAFLLADDDTNWEAVAQELLFKLLGAFGLSDFYAPILEILLGGDFADVWKDLLEALAKASTKEAIKILIKRFLLSEKFAELLIKKLGKEAAEKVLEKIAEKWIPLVGWAILIGNILAVIISQIIYYSSVVFGPFIIR